MECNIQFFNKNIRVKYTKMTAWTDAVSAAYQGGKAKNPLYSLKDAMFAAKKVYRSSSKTVSAVANKVVPVGRKNKTSKRRKGRRGTAKKQGKK
jgi:hypothetical protein